MIKEVYKYENLKSSEKNAFIQVLNTYDINLQYRAFNTTLVGVLRRNKSTALQTYISRFL